MSNMMKMLPISSPLSSTYMVPAGEFALLQSFESGLNYIYNRYIQLYLFEDIIKRDSTDVGLSILTDPYDHNPCFITTKIELQYEYLIHDYKDFIIDNINHGTYVYTYRYVDEYYIKDTTSYNKNHLIHMFLIYGYDLDKKIFYTMGYNQRNLFSVIEFSFDEFDNAIQNIQENGHKYIILIQQNNQYNEELNLGQHRIKKPVKNRSNMI